MPKDHLLVEGNALSKAGVYFRPGKIIQAAKNLGVGVAAFERAADYTQTYVQGGRILIKHQAVACRLADMATKLAACARSCAKLRRGRRRSRPTPRRSATWRSFRLRGDFKVAARDGASRRQRRHARLRRGEALRDAAIFLHMDATVVSRFKIVKALFPETAGAYAGPEQ